LRGYWRPPAYGTKSRVYSASFSQHKHRHAEVTVLFRGDLLGKDECVLAEVGTSPAPMIHDLAQADVPPIMVMVAAARDLVYLVVIGQYAFHRAVGNGGQPGEVVIEIPEIGFARSRPPGRNRTGERQVGGETVCLDMELVTM